MCRAPSDQLLPSDLQAWSPGLKQQGLHKGVVLDSGLLTERGQGQGQYCGHVYISSSSLTVPAGTP